MLNDKWGNEAEFRALIDFRKSEKPVKVYEKDNGYKKFLLHLMKRCMIGRK